MSTITRENQGTISYHGLVEELKKKDKKAIIKVTVHNKSKHHPLEIHNVAAYVQVGSERYDQTVYCYEELTKMGTKHCSKTLELTVLLPDHAHGVSSAKIGIVIPKVGHVELNSVL